MTMPHNKHTATTKINRRHLEHRSRGVTGKKASKTSYTNSGKRASLECCAPVEDVPESSTGKRKKSRVELPQTKMVSVREDGTGGAFTIGSTLDSK